MGNSEVGHMNIGAGRRVVQDQVRINESIDERNIFQKWCLAQRHRTGENKPAKTSTYSDWFPTGVFIAATNII
jgi:bisphosphoglycerate-independent phosphoglycerate mutase (AlkP superfamily)